MSEREGRGGAGAASADRRRRYRTLYAVLAVCAAPVLAAYVTYYVLPPQGRTNYGDLVLPQRPLPALELRLLDGTPFDPGTLRGRWVLLHVGAGACEPSCERKLWTMRQLRLTTGKDRDRIERLWLVTDDAPPPTQLLREYDGTRVLRARSEELLRFLELPPAGAARLSDHVWVVDPLGNLMLRWPKDADPNRMKRDIGKLLRASRVG
jgi:hypothetical protein